MRVGGSKAVWNFSENSSVLVGPTVPYHYMMVVIMMLVIIMIMMIMMMAIIRMIMIFLFQEDFASD